MDQVRDSGLQYEAPTVKVIGSVRELTLQIDKKFGPTDGYTLMGVAISNASP